MVRRRYFYGEWRGITLSLWMKCALPFLIVAASALLPSIAAAQYIPAINYPVNDYAGILTWAQEERIAKMLVEHRKKTGVQIAVLTVGTTRPVSIEEFSIKTTEKWGGGSKERDDGLLLTVAVYDRRMRIEVGYGLEGYITDLKAGRILDGIRDDFRKYRYSQGIEKAVAQIIQATDELRPGEEVPASARLQGAFFHLFKFHISYFILGALIGVFFMLAKHRLKFSIWITLLLSVLIYAGIPVLLQMYMPGVWYWAPVVFITGAIAGAGIVGATAVPQLKVLAIVVNLIPALISLGNIIYNLHILRPLQETGTMHETVLLIVLCHTNFFQLLFLVGVNSAFSETGGSYNSGGYTQHTTSSSSSSSSYNSTSWSGGGGSFGGGGASSSW